MLENVKKELKTIGEQGLNNNNIDMAYKLVDMYKDLEEGMSLEKGKYQMRDYERNGGDYGSPWYYERSYMGDYREGGRYGEKINRIKEGAEMYEYGRDSYRHGGSHEKIYDGLEKMMYAICVFIEHAMADAQTPQEKEIIRKHISKLNRL